MADRPEKLTELLDLLGTFHDRADRIQTLIDTADRFKGVPEHIATRPYPEERKTPACESDAYVFAEELSDIWSPWSPTWPRSTSRHARRSCDRSPCVRRH